MSAPKDSAYVSLASVPPGRQVRLVEVEAGRGLKQRLASMGLVPGTSLRVISSGGGGPVVIAVKECRLVLGRGIVQKMIVE